ncbi:MAG: restriction endonuclease subunit S [Thermomicrobiales bacterium]
MVDRWTETTVGAVCAGIYDGPHATPKKTVQGPIFLGISNLQDGRIDLSSSKHLSEADFAKWTRRVTPKLGDVVFSYETRLGEAAMIPEGLRCCLGRRMALMRPDTAKVDARYLLYAFLGPEFQEVIRSRTIHGSTVDRIPLKEFFEFPITLPTIEVQRAIAHVLGTLDDKIELNRQMNQTLDEIARTLFRSWFVDFNPVRAKAEGRQPEGMDAETAALFPDRFVDSALGPIPEGWEWSTVNEIASLSKQTVKPGTFLDEQFHHYSLPAFDKGETPILEFGGQIASNKTLILPDTVLISKLNPHIPRIWLPNVHSGIRSIGSTEFLALVPKERNVRSFLFCLLKSRPFQQKFQSRVSGTTGSHQRVTPDGLLSIMATIPDRPLMLAFDQLAGRMLRYRQTNIAESETLAALRDTLLPELLSGRMSSQVKPEDGESW